ncbi:MAG TPA: hypothetical protein VLF88_01075 [Candidatus Babeliales bacterium]|nr:hypothetical protein [Candidatus Babeliales bacterium]
MRQHEKLAVAPLVLIVICESLAKYATKSYKTAIGISDRFWDSIIATLVSVVIFALLVVAFLGHGFSTTQSDRIYTGLGCIALGGVVVFIYNIFRIVDRTPSQQAELITD